MKKIFQIAIKDIVQTMQAPLGFLIPLVMYLLFTGIIGAAFGGIGVKDTKLPIGLIADGVKLEILSDFQSNMESSAPIEWVNFSDPEILRKEILDGDLAGGIILAEDLVYEDLSLNDGGVVLIADISSTGGQTVELVLKKTISRMVSSNLIADIVVESVNTVYPYSSQDAVDIARAYNISIANEALQTPAVTTSLEEVQNNSSGIAGADSAFVQSSPGMLVQYTINSILGTAAVIVLERKSRTLQRLLTSSLNITQVLAGHALFIFFIAFVQQSLLVIAGQFIFGVNYFQDPAAIWLMITAFSLWITGLGMLIGVAAKNSEQVILFSLLSMFLFTALGGAWFPLEGTSELFNLIGHLTPGAWVMDGFQNIIVRGLGFQSVLKPAGILLLFAMGFLTSSLIVFQVERRKYL